MRLDLVSELLRTIAELDRAVFPEGAALSWQPIMDGIDYADALQAVREHYSSLGSRDASGNVRRVIPADVRSRARAIAESRLRAAQRALPVAPPHRPEDRSPEVRAAVLAARQRVAEAEARYRERVAA
jgi:hypothetical protein